MTDLETAAKLLNVVEHQQQIVRVLLEMIDELRRGTHE